MQTYAVTLSYNGYSPEQYRYLVSLAMEALRWTAECPNHFEIEAETPPSGWSWGERVKVSVYETEVCMSSRYRQWTLPLRPANKNNIDRLVAKLEQVQSLYTPAQVEAVRQQTGEGSTLCLEGLEERVAGGRLTPGEKVRYGRGGYFATMGLGIMMLLVFISMLFKGVSFWEPAVEDLVTWGGNYYPLTASGEYWRLLTHLFVHIGVVHLAMNLYALYFIGTYLEPLAGRWRMLLLFVLTGLVAGVVSIWWSDNRVSAGASGGLFGLIGVLLALLVTGTAGKEMRAALLTNLCIYAGINLVMGLQENIDNAAHSGGLVSGFLLGLLVAGEHRWPSVTRWLRTGGVALPLLLITGFLLRYPFVKPFSYYAVMQEVAILDRDASWPFSNIDDKSKQQMAGEMERVSIPKWTEATTLMQGVNPAQIDSPFRKMHVLLQDYMHMRLREAAFYIQRADDSVHFSPAALQTLQDSIRVQNDALLQFAGQ